MKQFIIVLAAAVVLGLACGVYAGQTGGVATSTFSSHTGASSGVHGITGAVVGTSDAQTLSNKTFTGTTTIGAVAVSSLTSSGTIELTGGQIKFPDGTLQSIAFTTTPSISSFAAANHTHANAANGGNIPEGSVTNLTTDLTARLLLAGGTMTGVLTIEGIDVPTTKVVAFNMAGGTAPFTVASNTVVTNLNADLLDGQTGTYYAVASTLTTHTGASQEVHGLAAGSNVVGTADAQTLGSKTLLSPTIADFTNANHTHTAAANGGTISHTALTDKGTNTHAQIDTHIGASANVHGLVAGSVVVGTADAQTLSDKTFTGTTTMGAITATVITDSGLTATRIPYASTGGLLADSANMTWAPNTLTVTGTVSATDFTGNGALLSGIGGTAGNSTYTGVNTFEGKVRFKGELRIASSMECVPSADQSLANDAAIAPNAAYLRVAGNGGAVVLDTAPAISDGVGDGQIILIQGTSDTNTVQIADNCNCQLAGGQTFTLGKGDMIRLAWDSGDSDWYEISRSDN